MEISPTTRGLCPRRVQVNSKQAITYNKCRTNVKKKDVVNMYGYVYITTNLINDRVYIGQHTRARHPEYKLNK